MSGRPGVAAEVESPDGSRGVDSAGSSHEDAMSRRLFEPSERLEKPLHRLRVVPTEDDEDRQIVRFSFSFATLEDMLAVLSYWPGRLLVIRLRRFMETLGATTSHLQATE